MRAKLLLSCLIFAGSAQAQGLKFREDLSFERLKQTAKAENKYVFLDVMATWCSPCKAMEQSVYPDTALGSFLARNFISIKVQTDQTKSDSEFVKSWYNASKEIMNLYQVTGLPSMVFLSPEGKLLYKSVGFRSKEDLMADAKKALNPANSYELLMEAYFKGKAEKAGLDVLIGKTDSLGRKIMAQKMTFESTGKVKDSTAYVVLSKLSKVRPTVLKGNFSGNWKIDYPACEFGDKPLRAAAKAIRINQTAKGLELTRTSSQSNGPDILSAELLLPGSKLSSSNTSSESRKKLSRLFPGPSGNSFKEFSEVTFPDRDQSIDYVIVEDWNLNDPGALQITKMVYTNTGNYSLKLVYRKSPSTM